MSSSFTIEGGARLDTRKAEKDLSRFINKAERRKVKLGLDDKAFTQPLGRITGAADEFNKSLAASNARVIAFAASAGLMFAVQRALGEVAKSAIEVEKSLADVNVILGATTSNLQKFGKELFNIAGQTGQSFGVVSEAATELARQGLSLEETLKRTRDAMILTRLSGMDAASSVNALTAAMNTFKNTALDTTKIVNKMANVDAAFAVSTQDLAEALKRVGSSALDAGVNFDQLMAMVTAVQQTTARGGPVIGNALKSIFTRIQRTETLDQLERLGFAVRSLDGQTRPAITIMTELAKKIDTLTAAQKASTTELIGGVFQINVVKAALADLGSEYSIYNNALDTSVNSTNEAIARNEELNKTLSALVNKTFANVKKAAADIGKLTIAPALGGVLEKVNDMLENFDTGKPEGAGEAIAAGILDGIGKFIKGPGLIIGMAIIGKLLQTFGRFASDSFKEFFNINEAAKKRVELERFVNNELMKNEDLTQAILKGELSVADAEKVILANLKSRVKEQAKILTIVKQTSSLLRTSGVNVVSSDAGGGETSYAVRPPKTKSGGHIPNYSSGNVQDLVRQELRGASYATGGTKAIIDTLPGLGLHVRNDKEQVKSSPIGPFINPPMNSPEGYRHRSEAVKRTGMDPYTLSGGYVPNFARGVSVKKERSNTKVLKSDGNTGVVLPLRGNNTSQTLNATTSAVYGTSAEAKRVKALGFEHIQAQNVKVAKLKRDKTPTKAFKDILNGIFKNAMPRIGNALAGGDSDIARRGKFFDFFEAEGRGQVEGRIFEAGLNYVNGTVGAVARKKSGANWDFANIQDDLASLYKVGVGGDYDAKPNVTTKANISSTIKKIVTGRGGIMASGGFIPNFASTNTASNFPRSASIKSGFMEEISSVANGEIGINKTQGLVSRINSAPLSEDDRKQLKDQLKQAKDKQRGKISPRGVTINGNNLGSMLVPKIGGSGGSGSAKPEAGDNSLLKKYLTKHYESKTGNKWSSLSEDQRQKVMGSTRASFPVLAPTKGGSKNLVDEVEGSLERETRGFISDMMGSGSGSAAGGVMANLRTHASSVSSAAGAVFESGIKSAFNLDVGKTNDRFDSVTTAGLKQAFPINTPYGEFKIEDNSALRQNMASKILKEKLDAGTASAGFIPNFNKGFGAFGRGKMQQPKGTHFERSTDKTPQFGEPGRVLGFLHPPRGGVVRDWSRSNTHAGAGEKILESPSLSRGMSQSSIDKIKSGWPHGPLVKEGFTMVSPTGKGIDIYARSIKELKAALKYIDANKAGGIKSFKEINAEVIGKGSIPLNQLGFAGGHVPNFADPNRVRESIQGGIPYSQTYRTSVDTPKYSGPVIGNKRDEPTRQALRDAVMSHPDPKNAGKNAGWVPNYADGDDLSTEPMTKAGVGASPTADELSGLLGELKGDFKDLNDMGLTPFLDDLKGAADELKGLESSAETATKKFNAMEGSIETDKGLTDSSDSPENIRTNIRKTEGEISEAGKGFTEDQRGKLGGMNEAQRREMAKQRAEEREPTAKSHLDDERLRKPDASKKQKARLEKAQEDMAEAIAEELRLVEAANKETKKKVKELKEQNESLGNINDSLDRQERNNAEIGNLETKKNEAVQARDTAKEKAGTKFSATRNDAALQGSAATLGSAQTSIFTGSGPMGIFGNITEGGKQATSQLKMLDSIAKGDTEMQGIDKNQAARRANEMRESRNQKLSSAGMTLSFVAPMITSTLAKSGYISEEASGVAGGAAMGAGMGAMMGPAGMAVGAAAGAAISLPAYIDSLSEMNKLSKKFSKSAEVAAEKLTKFNSSTQKYITDLSNFNEALLDTSGKFDTKDLLERQEALQASLMDIPDEFLSKMRGATGSAKDIQDIFGKIQQDLQHSAQQASVASTLSKTAQDEMGITNWDNAIFKGKGKAIKKEAFTNTLMGSVDMRKFSEVDPESGEDLGKKRADALRKGAKSLTSNNKEFFKALKDLGVGPEVLAVLDNAYNENKGNLSELSKSFINLADKQERTKVITDRLAASQLAYQKEMNASTEAQDRMSAVLKQSQEVVTSLTSTLSSRFKFINDLATAKGQNQRTVATNLLAGQVKVNSPFQDAETQSRLQGELKGLQLQNKQTSASENLRKGIRTGLVMDLGTQFDKLTNSIQNTGSMQSEARQSVNQTLTKQIDQRQEVQGILNKVVSFANTGGQSNQSIADKIEELVRGSKLNAQGQAKILQKVRSSMDDGLQKTVLMSEQHKLEIQLLQANNEFQRQIAENTKVLATLGGIGDFVQGTNAGFDKVNKVFQERSRVDRSGQGAGGGVGVAGGRSDLQVLDLLRNFAKLDPESFPEALREGAVEALSSFNRQLVGEMRAGLSRGGNMDAGTAQALDAMDFAKISETQVAGFLKDRDPNAKVVNAIKTLQGQVLTQYQADESFQAALNKTFDSESSYITGPLEDIKAILKDQKGIDEAMALRRKADTANETLRKASAFDDLQFIKVVDSVSDALALVPHELKKTLGLLSKNELNKMRAGDPSAKGVEDLRKTARILESFLDKAAFPNESKKEVSRRELQELLFTVPRVEVDAIRAQEAEGSKTAQEGNNPGKAAAETGIELQRLMSTFVGNAVTNQELNNLGFSSKESGKGGRYAIEEMLEKLSYLVLAGGNDQRSDELKEGNHKGLIKAFQEVSSVDELSAAVRLMTRDYRSEIQGNLFTEDIGELDLVKELGGNDKAVSDLVSKALIFALSSMKDANLATGHQRSASKSMAQTRKHAYSGESPADLPKGMAEAAKKATEKAFRGMLENEKKLTKLREAREEAEKKATNATTLLADTMSSASLGLLKGEYQKTTDSTHYNMQGLLEGAGRSKAEIKTFNEAQSGRAPIAPSPPAPPASYIFPIAPSPSAVTIPLLVEPPAATAAQESARPTNREFAEGVSLPTKREIVMTIQDDVIRRKLINALDKEAAASAQIALIDERLIKLKKQIEAEAKKELDRAKARAKDLPGAPKPVAPTGPKEIDYGKFDYDQLVAAGSTEKDKRDKGREGHNKKIRGGFGEEFTDFFFKKVEDKMLGPETLREKSFTQEEDFYNLMPEFRQSFDNPLGEAGVINNFGRKGGSDDNQRPQDIIEGMSSARDEARKKFKGGKISKRQRDALKNVEAILSARSRESEGEISSSELAQAVQKRIQDLEATGLKGTGKLFTEYLLSKAGFNDKDYRDIQRKIADSLSTTTSDVGNLESNVASTIESLKTKGLTKTQVETLAVSLSALTVAEGNFAAGISSKALLVSAAEKAFSDAVATNQLDSINTSRQGLISSLSKPQTQGETLQKGMQQFRQARSGVAIRPEDFPGLEERIQSLVAANQQLVEDGKLSPDQASAFDNASARLIALKNSSNASTKDFAESYEQLYQASIGTDEQRSNFEKLIRSQDNYFNDLENTTALIEGAFKEAGKSIGSRRGSFRVFENSVEDKIDSIQQGGRVKLSEDEKRGIATQHRDKLDIEGRFAEGRVTQPELKSARDQALDQARKNGDKSGKAFQDAITARFTKGDGDLDIALEDMSLNLIDSFESHLNDALFSAVTGAKDVKEAFGDMADAMLDEITKMAIQATTRQIMGSIGGSPFGDAAGIQGAASGGLVTGGSGYKDDVPMMLQGGEFVVRKNSVDRFGSGLFKALNGYSSGGAVKPDPQSGLSSTMSIGGGGAGFSMRNAFVYDEDQNPTKGTLEVDSRLSRRSLMDSSNPRNQFRTGKEKTLQDYFTQKKQDTEQYNEEYQAYLDAKAARWNQAGITAAMMLGLNLSSGKDLGGLSGTAANMASGAQSAGKWMGFADGGSTKDDIPAMLMGGEYVMNRQAVEKYGMSTFDKLNKGQMPSFAEGGPVGNPQAINGQSGGAGSLTNNVNITVNLDNNGSVSSDIKSSATNENAAGSQRQQSKELARTIESAVLKVLVNEKRQGGMLN